MSPAPRVYRVELRNEFSEIPRLSDWLTDILGEIGVGDEVSHAIRLAVVEAATNVVSYAFLPDTEHVIEVTLQVEPKQILVVIADDGTPFDPLAQPPPPPVTDIESVAIGGLGISLMRQFSNGMRYERCGPTNRLEMTFLR